MYSEGKNYARLNIVSSTQNPANVSSINIYDGAWDFSVTEGCKMCYNERFPCFAIHV